MNKKILYIDMDGVCADFEKGVKDLKPDMLWTEEEVDIVCKENKNVFRNLPEIKGAVEAVNKLKEKYDIYFLSTPMHHVSDSYSDKRIWIKQKFGEWADKRLILTHRKDLNSGDFLIDDRLTNGSESFEGEHIHFGTLSFPTWGSVLEYLL